MLFITSAAAVFGIFAGLILYYSNHPSDTGDISNNPSSQAAVS